MSRDNQLWGAPRIRGELLKLGIDSGELRLSKYMSRCRNPPSQSWRTFLENHTKSIVSIDLFTVPTIRFEVLYVFLVLAHDRRRILLLNVTAHTTAAWTTHQLREAFPFDQNPKYLLRDRDQIFVGGFRQDLEGMGIEEVLSVPRFPWRRAYRERVVGAIRQECLDHRTLHRLRRLPGRRSASRREAAPHAHSAEDPRSVCPCAGRPCATCPIRIPYSRVPARNVRMG